MRPIGRSALDVLSTLPRGSRANGFSRTGDGSRRADLKKADQRALFDAAGLHGRSRRTTYDGLSASLAADEGYGDATIAELLGHARRGVTARHYIRRPDTALVAAADRVAERIAATLDRQKEGEVIELRATQREAV